MSEVNSDGDLVFKGAGAMAGLEVWCVENLRFVSVLESSHGKFYTGSAYLILNTTLLKNGLTQHDIHYWLGKDAKEVESSMVSDKAVELDIILGSRSVQYKEVQGHETEKFLSYFKPCIIPLEGTFCSEMGGAGNIAYQDRLFTCKGDHVVYVKEVPFRRSSLNQNDVFILDTQSKIFLFSGCNSSIQERAKALDVVQYIKNNNHGGKCDVATIEGGKFVGDSDVGEFWSLFGGYAPITREPPQMMQEKPRTPCAKLFRITKNQMSCIESSSLQKEMLSADKCFMLDCDCEIFVWMGRNATISERKTAISATEGFVTSQGRSTSSHITFLTDGSETAAFRSYFSGWSGTAESTLYEEGREKVAALFKQKGFDVKELPDKDFQPFIDCSGVLKVWRVDCHDLSPIPTTEHGKLFSGDCYIVQYVYPGYEKDETLFFAWLGQHSIMEDRVDAITLMCSMADSFKGHPVLAQVYEGKEPLQLFSIFQRLTIFKGGMSSGYKRFTSENEMCDETYDEESGALFRVQGSCSENMQAIQVDLSSSSLNSCYCYILQVGGSVFTWTGNLCSPRDHDLLDRMLDILFPMQQIISVREGSEPDSFWDTLGGKAEYAKDKEIKQWEEEPHLFACSFIEADFKVKEIFDFTQDDLTTEEVLVLDCFREIYVWIGLHAGNISKQEALTFGQKFLKLDILLEGLSPKIPIYILTEGHEPPFFTRFFDWDSSKAYMHGNSFERKLAILKGQGMKMGTPKRSASEATANSPRSKSLVFDSARRRSGSPAPRVWSPSSEPLSIPLISSTTSVARKLFPSPPDRMTAHESSTASLKMGSSGSQFQGSGEGLFKSPTVIEDPSLTSQNIGTITLADGKLAQSLRDSKVPYERLKVTCDDPVTGIDVTRREAYLSDEEFQEKFGMTKEAFYKLPKWRQNKHKMNLNLF
ncbi:villin-1 [Aristolochia californica]|uniref:villin-1 n=1 Tax=Aristolochia californica TaxID=171875 RepID=UPI0035DF32A4